MHGAEGGSRLGHVKSDAMRGLRHAAHRQVVALPKRRKPEGRSRSGDRGGLPHAATRGFARSYRINLRLLPELAFSSGHDGESKQESPARPHAAFHERQCRRGGKAPRPLTAHSCHLRRAYPAPRALAGLAGESRPPGPAKQSTPYFDVKVPPTLTSNYPLL